MGEAPSCHDRFDTQKRAVLQHALACPLRRGVFRVSGITFPVTTAVLILCSIMRGVHFEALEAALSKA